MMMTHRIVLKTHPLLTTHVRSVHSILFRSGLQTTAAKGTLITPATSRRFRSRAACRALAETRQRFIELECA